LATVDNAPYCMNYAGNTPRARVVRSQKDKGQAAEADLPRMGEAL